MTPEVVIGLASIGLTVFGLAYTIWKDRHPPERQ